MFNPTTFTGFHTWLSLIGLASGLVVTFALLRGVASSAWINLFLVSAMAATLTGFLFPFTGFLPSHGVGIVSTIALALAAWGWWGGSQVNPGRVTRVLIVFGTYLLGFVTIAQAFQKLPGLGGQGLGFAVAQALLLLVFVALGWAAQSKHMPLVGASSG